MGYIPLGVEGGWGNAKLTVAVKVQQGVFSVA